MKIKLDENLPAGLVADLAETGHEADTVFEERLQGAADAAILDVVKREGRVLSTLDKGIGDIRAYPPEEYAGIVLFRPGSAGRGAVLEFVRAHIDRLLNMDLDGRLVIVTEASIRTNLTGALKSSSVPWTE